jgi:K+-sensing histidine kinase KdpD
MSQEEVIHNLREQLARTEAQLAGIQRRKSSVVAMAVHDLRTPLAIIQGYSQLLAADLPDESDTAHEYITNILAHAESLGKMVDNLMALDLLESGRFRLNVGRGDLNEHVGQVIAQVEGLTYLKDIAITYQPYPTPVWVRIDADQIDRVLYNLLSHATKYARPGSRLQIDATHEGAYGRVTITDSERKLNRENLSRLFDLVDIDQNGPASLRGTDIGLVLARLIAEEHHGRVEAIGAAKKGVAFALYLPAAEG